MNITDIIMNEILNALEREGGTARIKRNEFAAMLGCVPSQINYVLTSRFTPEQGYHVESRRGGGGFITITKIKSGKHQILMHLINAVGDSLTEGEARIICENLYYSDVFTKTEVSMILASVSDSSLKRLSFDERDKTRALIMKNMLIAYVKSSQK